MASNALDKALMRIEHLLQAAAALLPAAADRHLDDYRQYMIQREPELAAEALAVVGDRCGADLRFWFVLEAVLQAMEADGRDLFDDATWIVKRKLK